MCTPSGLDAILKEKPAFGVRTRGGKTNANGKQRSNRANESYAIGFPAVNEKGHPFVKDRKKIALVTL